MFKQTRVLHVEKTEMKNILFQLISVRGCALLLGWLSYSHVVTLWKNAVYGKSVAYHTTVDKWLAYCVVIGYELIDQGKRFSLKDPNDHDLSIDKFIYYSMGYTGCGLDDFDKNGERRSVNFKFCKHNSKKAWFFFRSSKFHTDLLQPIRNYIDIVHEDYVKMLRMINWK